MKIKIHGLWKVLKREITVVMHDVDIAIIVLIAPMFYSLFYGSLYWNKTEHQVPIVVVDMDHSKLSQMLIRNLDAEQNIHITEEIPDLATAQTRVEQFEAQGALFIPQKFEASLKKGKAADIKVYLNTTRFLVSNDINKAVTEVALTAAASVRLHYFQTQGYSFEQAKELFEPLRAEIKPMFNTTETYGDFLIPAILALIIQQTLLMGVALAFAKEEEDDTLREAYALSNHSTMSTMAGKGAFYFILFSAYSFMFYTFHFSIFKIPFRGNPFALAALTILFLAAIIYFAVFIGTFFRRKIIALQVLAFTSYPIFLTTGYSWPMAALPLPLRILAQTYPLTPYLAAYTRITAMGASWGDVENEFLHLSILVVLSMALAWWRLKSILHKNMS
jgi:ABC-2 type transport system permease protein